jgi:IS4 transposase
MICTGPPVAAARRGRAGAVPAREIWDEEKQESIVFLTNLQEFGATTIAATYKDRWQVNYSLRRLYFPGERVRNLRNLLSDILS